MKAIMTLRGQHFHMTLSCITNYLIKIFTVQVTCMSDDLSKRKLMMKAINLFSISHNNITYTCFFSKNTNAPWLLIECIHNVHCQVEEAHHFLTLFIWILPSAMNIVIVLMVKISHRPWCRENHFESMQEN